MNIESKEFLLRGIKNDGHEFLKYEFHGNFGEACEFMRDLVLREIGDGDGENDDDESLWKLKDEIYMCFYREYHYEYADCNFRIDTMCPILHLKDFLK